MQLHEVSHFAAGPGGPRLSDRQLRVLRYIIEAGERGATQEEVQDRFGGAYSSYRARVGELAKLGLVKDSGKRRLTKRGCLAIVWVSARRRRPKKTERKAHHPSKGHEV